MIVKAKNESGTFETVKEDEPRLQKTKVSKERRVLLLTYPTYVV